MRTKLALSTILGALLIQPAWAFTVKHFKVEGLQRIQESTVLNNLPVHAGNDVSDKQTKEIIQDLYKTGFFDHVELYRDNDTLVIKVQERSVIGSIKIEGNDSIPKDKLQEAIKSLGLVEGNDFDQATLKKLTESIEIQYYNLGYYNAKVTTNVTSDKEGRVTITINISEGKVATIKQIKILGNKVFSTRKLLNEFSLSTPGLFSFITHDDQYSREKMEGDLEKLRSYYMDRGYLRYEINSVNVALSPERESVFITIATSEGAQYHVSNIELSGDLILPESQLKPLIKVKSKEIFSRQEVLESTQAIAEALGNKGYALARVNVEPEVDEATKTVFLNFHVVPGRRYYVRHVNFEGNNSTNDSILRRISRILEGEMFSAQKVKESKRKMDLLGYLRDTEVTTPVVPGTNNQVDVDYKLHEEHSASATLGAGYSQLDKFFVSLGFHQKNFRGTGKGVDATVLYSEPTQNVSLSYTDPFYTESGISRTLSAYSTRHKLGELNVANYTTNTYGLNSTYGIPVSENNTLYAGAGFDDTKIILGGNPSAQLTDFTSTHGTNLYQFTFNTGWNYQGLDRALFPTEGTLQNVGLVVSVPTNNHGLEYYTVSYNGDFYEPLTQSRNFVLHGSAKLGFGDGYGAYKQLPFLKNFFAGGIGSVRGYDGNTLGPQDSNNEALGGNLMTVASASIIFPNFINDKSLRTSIFVDGGNVFNTEESPENGGVNFNRLRYSTGLNVEWVTPVGPLDFSIARTLNARSGDKKQAFQFTVGVGF